MIKLLDCLCKDCNCENKLKICTKKTDIESMGSSYLKDNGVEFVISNGKQTTSIIVDKQELYNFLKEDLGK